jgi:hypothetical protein
VAGFDHAAWFGLKVGRFWRPENGFWIYFKHKEKSSDLRGIVFAPFLRLTANLFCVAHFSARHHEKNRSHYQTVQAG